MLDKLVKLRTIRMDSNRISSINVIQFINLDNLTEFRFDDDSVTFDKNFKQEETSK